MTDWNKEADWLPLSNAIARVKFWKKDLAQAEHFLDILQTMKVPQTNIMYKETLDDIEESKIGLAQAKEKLKESIRLEEIFS